jgi:hypothetical protein
MDHDSFEIEPWL